MAKAVVPITMVATQMRVASVTEGRRSVSEKGVRYSLSLAAICMSIGLMQVKNEEPKPPDGGPPISHYVK